MASPTRKNALNKRATTINHNIDSSNSTVNVFLGGKQKAWMHNHDATSPSQSSGHLSLLPLSSNNHASSRPAASRVSNDATMTNTQSVDGPTNSKSGPSHFSRNLNTQTLVVKRKRDQQTVLPSPTPSNEEPNQPSRAGTLPQHQAAVTSSDLLAEIGHANTSDGYPTDLALRMLQSQIEEIGGLQAQSRFEQARLQLLLDACTRTDYFYLILHQLFCSHSDCPQRLPSDILSTSSLNPAVSVLGQLLVANCNIKPSLVSWFSTFPFPLQEIGQRWPGMYQRELNKIKAFFYSLSERWGSFVDQCRRRASPPVARELVEVFSVSSILLQRIIFTSVLRGFWGAMPTPFSGQAEALFPQSQQEYHKWVSPGGSTASIKVIDETHAKTWRDLLPPHLEYLEAQKAQLQKRNPVRVPSQQAQQVTQHTRTNTSGAGPQVVQYSALPSPQQVSAPMLTRFPQSAGLQRRPSNVLGCAIEPATSSNRRFSDPVNLPADPIWSSATSTPIQTPIQSRSTFNGPVQRSGILATNVSMSHVPNQAAPQARQLLIPAAGIVRPQPANANPSAALHQAHLRSPILKLKSFDAGVEAKKRVYQYVTDLALPPVRISFSSAVSSITFSINTSDFRAVASDEKPSGPGGRPVRILEERSKVYRLRCCKSDSNLRAPEEHRWLMAETCWPSFVYFKVNDIIVEIRRKLHHGKDLPVDITRLVKEGENKIVAYANLGGKQKLDCQYAIAVEVVGLASYESIKDRCTGSQRLPAEESLNVIRASLSSSAMDDEIAVISSSIIINLVDPISSTKIADIPVRGRYCLHPDCFDLETFLLSRTFRGQGSPSVPDEWKCPLCKMDVRPQSLIVDDFIAQVSKRLADEGLSSTKSIVIEQDGSWKPKPEQAVERTEQAVIDEAIRLTDDSSKSVKETANGPEPVVITLD